MQLLAVCYGGWRYRLWSTKSLSKGSWDRHHYVWGKLLLVLVFSGWSRPTRTLGQEMIAVMLSPDGRSFHPTQSVFPSFPSPGLNFLSLRLTIQTPLEGLEILFGEETSTPSLSPTGSPSVEQISMAGSKSPGLGTHAQQSFLLQQDQK